MKNYPKNKPTDRRKKDPTNFYIYGKHPVLEALKNPNRKKQKLLCTKNSYNFLLENIDERELKSFEVEVLRPDQIDKAINGHADTTHQGLALKTEALEQPSLSDFFDSDLIIACDKITDPHNIGAIIRNALAFGAAVVLSDERNSPPENGTIAKTSAGCVEKIPYIRGKGLSSSINDLKNQGFLVIGLDGSADISLHDLKKKLGNEKILLIVGSEGKGISSHNRELCDYVTKIEISEHAESLNASVASAVALFVLSQ